MQSGTDDPTIVLSAAIITRAAEGPAAEVHTRMPLILPKEAEAVWLDREQVDGAKALEIAQAVAVMGIVHHAVSTRVNNSKECKRGPYRIVSEYRIREEHRRPGCLELAATFRRT